MPWMETSPHQRRHDPPEETAAVPLQRAPTASGRSRGDRRRHLVHSLLPRPARTHRRTRLHHPSLDANCHPCCRFILLPIFPVAHSSMTRLFSSTWSVPLEVSRMTSTLSQGSATRAQRPIWISKGPLRTLPPAEVNLTRASGTESTARSVSIGLSPVWSTNSAFEPGSFNPAA